MGINLVVAAAAELIIAGALVALLIGMAVEMVRNELRTRRATAARNARLASPEYLAARDAAAAAWAQFRADRTALNFDAWKAAAKRREALAR